MLNNKKEEYIRELEVIIKERLGYMTNEEQTSFAKTLATVAESFNNFAYTPTEIVSEAYAFITFARLDMRDIIYDSFEILDFMYKYRMPKEPKRTFDSEKRDLNQVIYCASRYCKKQNFEPDSTKEFVEGKIKRFLKVIMGTAAANNDLYEILIDEQPNLENYIRDKVEEYRKTTPKEDYFQNGLIKLVEVIDDVEENSSTDACRKYITEQIEEYGYPEQLINAVKKVKPDLVKFVNDKYYTDMNKAHYIEEDRATCRRDM